MNKQGLLLRPLLAILLTLVLSGCSMLLIEASTNKLPLAENRTDRKQVLKNIGLPDNTASNKEDYTCDQYRLNRLIQTPKDPYYYEWNQYPALLFLSLGLVELIVFPITAYKLSVDAFQSDYLSLYYDEDNTLINYTRSNSATLICN